MGSPSRTWQPLSWTHAIPSSRSLWPFGPSGARIRRPRVDGAVRDPSLPRGGEAPDRSLVASCVAPELRRASRRTAPALRGRAADVIARALGRKPARDCDHVRRRLPDNLIAATVLADRRLPATVFVVSTPLGHGAEFWWDQLDRVVLRTASLPDRLALETENRVFSWAVPELYSAREAAQVPSTWRAWEPPRHDRQRLYLELYDILFAATPDERGHLMEQLASWAATATKGNDARRAMTTQELVDLASVPGIEIGAHTQSHPRLADLPAAVQEQEIDGSRRTLEQLVATRVSSFSYPFGRQSDYTHETVDLVRRASFELACPNVRGLVAAAADRLQLPRLQVHDWERTEFERWLMDSLSNGS